MAKTPTNTNQRRTPGHVLNNLAWTVPTSLLLFIGLCLWLHLPMYTGLLAGTIWAGIYAKRVHSWSEIARAALEGAYAMRYVCLVLLLVGAVVSLWMADGCIPLLTKIGDMFLSSTNLVWLSFLFTAILSLVIGSSIATWSVLGPPLMAIAPTHAAPLVAGALVSGAMVGDRTSPMSTSVIVMSTACDLPYNETLRRLTRSAIIPFTVTLVLYWMWNWFMVPSSHHQSGVGMPLPAWWLLFQPVLVIALAIARRPLWINLLLAILLGLVIGLGTASVHPMQVTGVLWHGVHETHENRTVGGIRGMVSAVALILSAGLFQGAAKSGGSMDELAALLFNRARHNATFGLFGYGVCALFSLLMGSQMLSVVMSGNTIKPHFLRRGWSADSVLRIVGDTAELLPAIIPWNLLGLQAAAILGVQSERLAPFSWYILISLGLSILSTLKYASKLRLKGIPKEDLPHA